MTRDIQRIKLRNSNGNAAGSRRRSVGGRQLMSLHGALSTWRKGAYEIQKRQLFQGGNRNMNEASRTTNIIYLSTRLYRSTWGRNMISRLPYLATITTLTRN